MFDIEQTPAAGASKLAASRSGMSTEPQVLAVIVPAHNEEQELEACLQSVARALRWPALRGETALCVVALDACHDDSAAIAHRAGAATVSLNLRNVGAARAAGAALALAAGARWLAFTDADSQVAPGWLHDQLALASDVVCGTVAVDDWGDYGAAMHSHYRATYTDADGHHHIHGANLGVSAAAYRRAGGFQPLVSSEDVALVQALQASGARIAWSAAPRVITSARRSYRAPGGFGATLQRVAEAARSAARVAAAA